MALLSSNLAATAAGVGTVTSLLEELVAQQSIGCLSIQIASVEWEIALQHGNRVFATHSLDPLEKLDRHLHRLSFQNRALTTELREQVKKRLSDSLKTLSKVEAECSTLRWLLDLACLQETEAEELYRRLTLESLESCLESSGFKHHFLKVELAEIAQQWPTLSSVLEQCAEQAKTWRSLAPPILSPYQRPQLSEAGKNLSMEQQGRFSHLLIGFSFRQLSGLLNQDEVTIAQYLQPLILEGMVELLGPHSPYDQIPLVQSNPRICAVHPSSGPEAAPRQQSLGKTSSIAFSLQPPESMQLPPLLLRFTKGLHSSRLLTWCALLTAGLSVVVLLTRFSNHWFGSTTSNSSEQQLLHEYQSLIKDNPKDFYALVMLNNLYVGRGQYQQALPVIQKIIELRPSNLEWQLTLARVYDLAGQERSAVQVYDRILAQDSQHFEALLGKARLLQSQEDLEISKRFYQRAAQAAPSESHKATTLAESRRLDQP